MMYTQNEKVTPSLVRISINQNEYYTINFDTYLFEDFRAFVRFLANFLHTTFNFQVKSNHFIGTGKITDFLPPKMIME